MFCDEMTSKLDLLAEVETFLLQARNKQESAHGFNSEFRKYLKLGAAELVPFIIIISMKTRYYVVGSKSFRPDQLFKLTNKTTLLFFNIVSLYFQHTFQLIH